MYRNFVGPENFILIWDGQGHKNGLLEQNEKVITEYNSMFDSWKNCTY